MLNYLEKTTRPELVFAVHQCARFCVDLKLSHERAAHRIVKYLIGTKNKGLVFRPDKRKDVKVYVHADFAGSWNNANSNCSASVLSRTRFVIMYHGCPLRWHSKLQTEIALFTTEAEYIALSQSMRELIPLMNLLGEIAPLFGIVERPLSLRCRLSEDNKSCLALAKAPRMNPRTKYISLKYHHFRSFVASTGMELLPIRADDQIADIFTKPLPDE